MNICLCNQALGLFICRKQRLAVQQALVSQLPFVLIASYFHTSALLATSVFPQSFPASQHLLREASAFLLTRSLLPLCKGFHQDALKPVNPPPCAHLFLSSREESEQGSKTHIYF